MKSASLVVIGDEILTGKVKDENSFVFAQTMFERGVTVRRMITIPDEVDVIALAVAQEAQLCDYVCTSGGVGPTHDDVTFLGIAQGLKLPLKLHDEALRHFQSEQSAAGRGETVSDVQRKMLEFPYPCQLYFLRPLWLPLVQIQNVFVFPGVPSLFERLMLGMAHLFVGGRFYRKLLYTDRSENIIALDLKALQDKHPDVKIGSYPQYLKPFSVMVTVEGTKEASVSRVYQALLPLIAGRTTEKGPA